MSGFEVLVLGVGDTFSERHHPTSLLLDSDGFKLAIDCPDMYRSVLKHATERSGRNLTLSTIDHVLITHVHGDHMNGLEGVAFYKHFVDQRSLTLVAAPEVRAPLWEQRLVASMGVLWDGQRFRNMAFDDYFQHVPLPYGETIDVGPFRIGSRRTLHHVPTSALFIEAGGRSLGYSSDTAFDPELIQFLEPADLIIHETNFGPAHTPYASLLTLPEAIQSKMCLIHYPDSFEPSRSVIRALSEGEVLHP